MLLLIALAACAGKPGNGPEGTPPPAPADSTQPLPYPPPAQAANSERWIEVDLSQQIVRLYEGDSIVKEYPVATGLADSPSTRTYTGTFTVHTKIKPATYLSEFGVYVSDWVGFDAEHAIGFHSLPKDEYGRVLDSRLGEPVSHGCVRVGNAAAVYNFARIGMKVVVR